MGVGAGPKASCLKASSDWREGSSPLAPVGLDSNPNCRALSILPPPFLEKPFVLFF